MYVCPFEMTPGCVAQEQTCRIISHASSAHRIGIDDGGHSSKFVSNIQMTTYVPHDMCAVQAYARRRAIVIPNFNPGPRPRFNHRIFLLLRRRNSLLTVCANLQN